MDVSQQFCLRWNNYQSTLHHVFHKLWASGTFVDVSLVVEGRKIDCHKVILSACSTYFEQLLSEHSSHPHPLVLLHDIPFTAVESLVTFMYKGEINVSQDQLTAVLKVAESLKIKGLADSAAISNFTKYRLLSTDITKISSQYSYPTSTAHNTNVAYIPQVNGNSAARCYSMAYGKGFPLTSHTTTATPTTPIPTSIPIPTPTLPPNPTNGIKRPERSSSSPIPMRKRPRQEEHAASLPPSPPISLEEPQNNEQARSSPRETCETPEIKTEAEEETDNELQIDESAGQSPSDYVDSDDPSNRNTPVLDAETQEMNERHETAQALAALSSQGTINLMTKPHSQPHSLPHSQPLLAPKPTPLKEEKSANAGGKNGERSYTLQDLEDGIESVLMGHLTPAKAIAKYKVPRRTFFRRLSAVRKSRGIPSSKENASEHFLNSSSVRSPATQNSEGKSAAPIVIPGVVSSEPAYMQNINKVPKTYSAEEVKKEKKVQGLNLTSGNVFSLLNVVANPSYEYYLKYLKLQTQGKDIADDKRESVMDGNRNLSSDVPEQALALVTQNGSVK